MNPYLSILIPCYRSSDSLVELVTRLAFVRDEHALPTLELILVNDGSDTPETWQTIERLARDHEWIHGIDLGRNVGQVRATLCGMRRARGEIVLTMDDDLQHPPEAIPPVLAALRSDPQVDAVVGAFPDKQHGRLRNLGTRVVRRMMLHLYGMSRHLELTSLRAMRRRVVEAICAQPVHPVLGAMLFRATRRVVPIQVAHQPRAHGRSTYTLGKLTRRFAAMLFAKTPILGALARSRHARLPRPARTTPGAPRRILILGVANPQVDAIRHLQEAGWWVAACSYRAEGPGLALADHFEVVDIRDEKNVTELAARLGVDAVYSVGSDIAMPVAARVSARLGLPSLTSPRTVAMLQDKIQLRTALAKHGLNDVRHRVVRCARDCEGWDLFPAILKPTDSQGQRGVFRCENLAELKLTVAEALPCSPSGTLILEEFLEGQEVSVHAFVLDGAVAFLTTSDRLVVEDQPGGIAREHVMPSDACTGDARTETENLVHRCIHALGIDSGPVYFQLKMTPSGPRIIEIAARLDGCHLWRLIRIVHGIDLIAATMDLLTGARPDLKSTQRPTTRMRISFRFSRPEERFHPDDHPAPEDAVFSEDYYADGERVRPVNQRLERIGYDVRRA